MIREGAWVPSHAVYIRRTGLNAPRLWYSILVRRMLIGGTGGKGIYDKVTQVIAVTCATYGCC